MLNHKQQIKSACYYCGNTRRKQKISCTGGHQSGYHMHMVCVRCRKVKLGIKDKSHFHFWHWIFGERKLNVKPKVKGVYLR